MTEYLIDRPTDISAKWLKDWVVVMIPMHTDLCSQEFRHQIDPPGK
jgi:hypothetical protein